MRRGFTLVELLVYLAIFSVVVVAFIAIFIAITRVQTSQSSEAEVESQSQFLLQQVQYYVEQASSIDMPLDTATTTLKLRMSSTTLDPTYVTLSNGTLYLQQGASGTLQALTSNQVTISAVSFTKHSNAPSHDSVGIALTVSYNTSNIEQAFSQALQTSIATLNQGGVGAWQTTQSPPIRGDHCNMAAYNGYAYCLQGVNRTSTAYSAQINSDGTLGDWSAVATSGFNPSPSVDSYSPLVIYSNFIYALADDPAFTSTVSFWRPASSSWVTTQALPYRVEDSGLVAYNGYLYVLGGDAGGSTSTVLYAPINNSDGTIGTWQSTQSLPYTTDIGPYAFAYNNYIYAVAGESTLGPTSTVLYAPINSDGTIGAWQQTQPVPDPNVIPAFSDGYFYLVGISTAYYAPVNPDGTIGYWQPTGLPSQNSSYGSSFIYNGYLYAADASNTVYAPLL